MTLPTCLPARTVLLVVVRYGIRVDRPGNTCCAVYRREVQRESATSSTWSPMCVSPRLLRRDRSSRRHRKTGSPISFSRPPGSVDNRPPRVVADDEQEHRELPARSPPSDRRWIQTPARLRGACRRPVPPRKNGEPMPADAQIDVLARSPGIAPGEGPGSDRPDSSFRASNQDQTVRMLVHMVHPFSDHAPDLGECGSRSIASRFSAVERCWSGPRQPVRAPFGRPFFHCANPCLGSSNCSSALDYLPAIARPYDSHLPP
jgi:hypothetical protein